MEAYKWRPSPGTVFGLLALVVSRRGHGRNRWVCWLTTSVLNKGVEEAGQEDR